VYTKQNYVYKKDQNLPIPTHLTLSVNIRITKNHDQDKVLLP